MLGGARKPPAACITSLKGVIVLLVAWADLIDILNSDIYVLNMYLKNDWFSIYGSNTKFSFKSIFPF